MRVEGSLSSDEINQLVADELARRHGVAGHARGSIVHTIIDGKLVNIYVDLEVDAHPTPILKGKPDAACEPCTRDRLFYKPHRVTLGNGEVREFRPPNPPFEPCPGVSNTIGTVVKATHQALPPDPAVEPSDKAICLAEAMQLLENSMGKAELNPLVDWPGMPPKRDTRKGDANE